MRFVGLPYGLAADLAEAVELLKQPRMMTCISGLTHRNPF
jgi:hypothetical protein